MFELPTRLVEWSCALEAVDPARNVARAYQIRASRDLFGHTIVELRWGRIGTRGAGATISFESEDAAQRFIKRALSRRASAPRRCGAAYERIDQGRAS